MVFPFRAFVNCCLKPCRATVVFRQTDVRQEQKEGDQIVKKTIAEKHHSFPYRHHHNRHRCRQSYLHHRHRHHHYQSGRWGQASWPLHYLCDQLYRDNSLLLSEVRLESGGAGSPFIGWRDKDFGKDVCYMFWGRSGGTSPYTHVHGDPLDS